MNVKIAQITSPWNFLIKKDKDELHEMQAEMLRLCEMGQSLPVHNPKEGEIYATLSRSGNSWQRVLIKSKASANSGFLHCKLIDQGKETTIGTTRIVMLPNKYKEVPCQVQPCCLYGVQPLNYRIEETDNGLKAKHKPDTEWKNCSINFMEEQVKISESCRIELIDLAKDSLKLVRLYLKIRGEVVCFNDLLVEEKYASPIDNKEMFLTLVNSKISKDEILKTKTNNNCIERFETLITTSTPHLESMSDTEMIFSNSNSIKTTVARTSSSQHNLSPISSHLPDFLFHKSADDRTLNTKSQYQTSDLSASRLSGDKSVHRENTTGVKSTTEAFSALFLGRGRGKALSAKFIADKISGASKDEPCENEVGSTFKSCIKHTNMSLKQQRSSVIQKESIKRVSFIPETSSSVHQFENSESIEENKVKTPIPTKEAKSHDVESNISVSSNEEFMAVLHQDKTEYVKQQKRQETGKMFLESLRAESGQMFRSEILETTHHGKPKPEIKFGTIAQGKGCPSLVCSAQDVPFVKPVHKALEKMKITDARGLQLYTWTSILKWRHVVGVCPAGHGKTLAYLPPLISSLSEQAKYLELPRGKGPLCVVIVPTWKRAQKVRERVEMLTSGELSKVIKVLCLYAGGIEGTEEIQISLLQGCEILVSTPNSLLRMLKEDFTSLTRLCHVVLDDADILARDFSSEVDEVLQMYAPILHNLKELTVPKQILIFSNTWTEDINSFMLKYTMTPIVVISSRLEASIYGKVKQIVKMSRPDSRLRTLCLLLDQLAQTPQKMIVFTSEVEEALLIHEAIKSRGVMSLIIHQDLDDVDMAQARRIWLETSSNKLVAMVCTDQCYQDLCVTDATTVISYQLPDSKTKFGNRMACMYNYFYDRTQDLPKQKNSDGYRVEPQSYVIVTDECKSRAKSLLDVINRGPAEHSPDFLDYIKGYHLFLERNAKVDLCPLLKAFGTCRQKPKCKHRHVVIPSMDLKTGEDSVNSLPASGIVKIRVIKVRSSNHLYCHLMSHRAVDQPEETDLRSEYQLLTLRMSSFFCRTSNQIPYIPTDNPANDGLCAFRDDSGVYSRAKVLEVRPGTKQKPMKQCRLWLVDEALERTGTIDQLVTLPRTLALIPYQAVEVFVCRVKPVENDTEFTDKANNFLRQLVEEKELAGRIVLRLGMSLWLDPVFHQRKLSQCGTVNDVVIHQELLSNLFAVRNPDHIKNMYDLCRGLTEIPEEFLREYYDYCLEAELTQETLGQNTEFHNVLIGAVVNPGHFYLQKQDTYDSLLDLEKSISDEMTINEQKQSQDKMDSNITLSKGSVCLGKSSDDSWYRGKILSTCEAGKWSVYFLDYGDTEWLSIDAVVPLPRRFAELPCQAIECQLAHVKPFVENWEPSTVDLLCDLTYYLDGEKKQLFAKVLSKTEPVNSIGMKLVVDLYETSDTEVGLSQELVWHKLAQSSHDSLSFRFEKPALSNQMFFNELDKIPYLCAKIYWEENEETVLEMTSEVCELLLQRQTGWDEALEQRDVVDSVVQLLGYLPFLEAHWLLLQSLTQCCCQSERIYEQASSVGLSFRLGYCLEQLSKPELQLQASKVLSSLSRRKRFRQDAINGRLLSIIAAFIYRHSTSSLSPQILQPLCSTASNFLLKCENVCWPELMDTQMIEMLVNCLQKEQKDLTCEPIASLLSVLATYPSCQDILMRESFRLNLLKLLESSSQCKLLPHLLNIFITLVDSGRKHKRVLFEDQLLLILQALLRNKLQSPSLELCQALLDKMKITLPEPEALSGVRVDSSHIDIVAPDVRWRQMHHMLFLSVHVPHACEKDFRIRTNHFSCRVVEGNTSYELEWELFDSVIPQDSSVDIQANHAQVSLRKQNKGFWSRLLKTKTTPSNLSLDLDNNPNLGLDDERIEVFRDVDKNFKSSYQLSSEEQESELESNSDLDEPVIDYEQILLENNFFN